MGKPFYVYLLVCSDGSFYTGHTDDLQKRFREHQQGGKCVYTSRRRPVQPVWSRECATREDAKRAELRVKSWSRAKKAALIAGAFDVLHELAKKQDWPGYRERRKARPAESGPSLRPPSRPAVAAEGYSGPRPLLQSPGRPPGKDRVPEWAARRGTESPSSPPKPRSGGGGRNEGTVPRVGDGSD